MKFADLPKESTGSGKSCFLIVCALIVFSLGGCQQELPLPTPPNLLKSPKGDIMNPPKIFDTRQEYGHIQTTTVIVSATGDIFLAEAEEGTIIRHPNGQEDVSPANSPLKILEGIITGGEMLDVYATGKARHLPIQSIEFGPRGWLSSPTIEAGPAAEYESIEGHIGSLIGLFDNQRQPFLIGQKKHIEVPRYANCLYLAMLDYPGASSDNQGQYFVTIYVLRR